MIKAQIENIQGLERDVEAKQRTLASRSVLKLRQSTSVNLRRKLKLRQSNRRT